MPRIQNRDHGTSVSYRPWLNLQNDQQSFADLYTMDAAFRPAASAKDLSFAFPIDGVGDLKPPFPTALILTTDNVPDSIGGNPVITVGAPSTISTIDTIGDQDFFQITLVAGKSYEIGMYGYTGGPGGAPLLDSYVELYDSAGNLVVSADGGADTPANDVNSGFDVLLSFDAQVSGTYYINARSFDNTPFDGITTGDGLGDYELFAKEVDPNDPNVYHPYYGVDSPLYAIDWGTRVNKVNQSAPNPDGNEGTRDTGNAQGTPVFGSVNDIPALAAAQHVDITGKNVITIYFARAGDVFVSNDPTNPGLPPATITAVGVLPYEHDAVITALGEFSKVADIVYLEVDDRAKADFVYTSYQGTPGPGVSLLGSMSPPDESDEGLAQFNSGDERWNELNLQQGGFSYVTLIHEFGHGHGLAHPHDNGGHSGIMNGVEPEGLGVADYTTGEYHLNQSVFTMMSYEDGWQDSPYGNADTDVGYGYLGSLMAFDIAAIQDKYGVNENYNTGDNTYILKDVNAAGTYYSSIWDGGGIDAIAYGGARDATIDLRPATLLYEEGGGGRVSFAYGIYGGFTVANGVTIENATGGSGNDTINGNAVDNILNGGAGMDQMTGFGGNDIYYVDNAGDKVIEATNGGGDIVYSSVGYTLNAGAEIELLSTASIVGTQAIDLTGNELVNTLWGNAGANNLHGGGGADTLIGFGGNDNYYVADGGERIIEDINAGTDIAYASLSYTLTAGASIELLSTFSIAGTEAINLTGNALVNTIWGNNGANQLSGGGGADTLVGFLGNDTYTITDGAERIIENANEGTDIAYAAVNYVLNAGASVELLSTNSIAGTNAINLTGNELANTIWGNGGANTLNGGLGADSLLGFGGNDTFAFTTALGNGNVDQIVDFLHGGDKIALDDAVFTGIGGPGALNANVFVIGTAAGDADDRIIYDSASGNLYFDADGNGAGAAVLFATLQDHPTLSASDFAVI